MRSICKDTFVYFECQDNPTAPSNLNFFPDVACWSALHLSAMWLAVSALLINVCFVYALLVTLAWKAPELFVGPNRITWRGALAFLVAQWQPDSWYWSVVYLTRNAFLALTPLVFENGFMQILRLTPHAADPQN